MAGRARLGWLLSLLHWQCRGKNEHGRGKPLGLSDAEAFSLDEQLAASRSSKDKDVQRALLILEKIIQGTQSATGTGSETGTESLSASYYCVQPGVHRHLLQVLNRLCAESKRPPFVEEGTVVLPSGHVLASRGVPNKAFPKTVVLGAVHKAVLEDLEAKEEKLLEWCSAKSDSTRDHAFHEAILPRLHKAKMNAQDLERRARLSSSFSAAVRAACVHVAVKQKELSKLAMTLVTDHVAACAQEAWDLALQPLVNDLRSEKLDMQSLPRSFRMLSRTWATCTRCNREARTRPASCRLLPA